MADKIIYLANPWGNAGAGDPNPAPIRLVDNGDGTYSIGTDAVITNATITTATMKIDQATAHANEVILKSALVGLSDNGPAWASVVGVSGAAFASANQSAAAAAVTDAPTAGQKIVLTDLVVSVDTALTVTFTEETSGTVKAVLYMAANSTAQITARGKIKLDTADKRLMVRTSASGHIAVTAVYYSEA
jgi:hypothetical protein